MADFLWLAGETGRSETPRDPKWRPTEAAVSQACEPLSDAKVCACSVSLFRLSTLLQVGVWFAAPPGAGKSTLIERVQHYGIWGQDCLWDQNSVPQAAQIKVHLQARTPKLHTPGACTGKQGCELVYQLSKVLIASNGMSNQSRVVEFRR